MKRRSVLASIVLSLVTGCAPRTWIGSWSASPQDTDEPVAVGGLTVRYPVRLSVGGARLRVAVGNELGPRPLRVGALHLAWRGPKGREDRAVSFHGRGGVEVAARGRAISDPVELAVPDLAEVEVSVFFPEETALATEHSLALGPTQLSVPGDFTGAARSR